MINNYNNNNNSKCHIVSSAGKELFQTGFGNDVLDQRREE
jgi:hypothetical protein